MNVQRNNKKDGRYDGRYVYLHYNEEVVKVNLFCSEIKRKFSFSMYKNLKILLGEMTFAKDFVNDTCGDLYPLIQKSEDCIELVENNCYAVKKGMLQRLFCQFFPYATYEVKASLAEGEIGFCFRLPNVEATVVLRKDKLVYSCADDEKEVDFPKFIDKDLTLIVGCRPGAFDIYSRNSGRPEFVCTFYEEKFRESNQSSSFFNGYVCLHVSGNSKIKEVLSYIDNGVSIADIRPIKYENGEIILEQGKVYFTASIRMQEGTFQGIFSWVPGTAEFQMTGALFYDCGDGKWRNYVAPVILYHRDKKQWYVWVSSFEHEHILAYGAFEGEPRFGVNVVK